MKFIKARTFLPSAMFTAICIGLLASCLPSDWSIWHAFWAGLFVAMAAWSASTVVISTSMMVVTLMDRSGRLIPAIRANLSDQERQLIDRVKDVMQEQNRWQSDKIADMMTNVLGLGARLGPIESRLGIIEATTATTNAEFKETAHLVSAFFSTDAVPFMPDTPDERR